MECPRGCHICLHGGIRTRSHAIAGVMGMVVGWGRDDIEGTVGGDNVGFHIFHVSVGILADVLRPFLLLCVHGMLLLLLLLWRVGVAAGIGDGGVGVTVLADISLCRHCCCWNLVLVSGRRGSQYIIAWRELPGENVSRPLGHQPCRQRRREGKVRGVGLLVLLLGLASGLPIPGLNGVLDKVHRSVELQD